MIEEIKAFVTKKYVYWRTRGSLKELNDISIDCPLDASRIKNALVILPREVEYVDAAVTLVHKMRRHFTRWHYMVLDIDKILHHKLNRLDLPNEEFIEELRKNNFDFALNLNFKTDLRIDYMLAMLKIPYRLHLLSSLDEFYNIVVQADPASFKNFDYVQNYLQTIFTTGVTASSSP